MLVSFTVRVVEIFSTTSTTNTSSSLRPCLPQPTKLETRHMNFSSVSAYGISVAEECPKLSSKLGQNRNLMKGQRNCGPPEPYNASESGKVESKVLQCWQVGTCPSLTLQKLHKWDCMDYCDSDTVEQIF